MNHLLKLAVCVFVICSQLSGCGTDRSHWYYFVPDAPDARLINNIYSIEIPVDNDIVLIVRGHNGHAGGDYRGQRCESLARFHLQPENTYLNFADWRNFSLTDVNNPNEKYDISLNLLREGTWPGSPDIRQSRLRVTNTEDKYDIKFTIHLLEKRSTFKVHPLETKSHPDLDKIVSGAICAKTNANNRITQVDLHMPDLTINNKVISLPTIRLTYNELTFKFMYFYESNEEDVAEFRRRTELNE